MLASTAEKEGNFFGNEFHENGLDDCPARGKQCYECDKFNHFAKCCIKNSRARIGGELKVRVCRVDLSIAISHINKSSRRTGRTDGDILKEERWCLMAKKNLILKRRARNVNWML